MSRHTSPRPHPGWTPYRGRPYPRRPVAPHRNRTLVLNNAVAAGSTPSSASSAGTATDNEGEVRSSTPGSGWVAKRDRHMQLINSAIYDKEAQARTKALEESRKLKAQKRTQIEEAKVLRYAQGAGRKFPISVTPQTAATSQPSAGYQIFVDGIPFRISRGGSKLIRLSSAIPTRIEVRQGASLPFTIDDPKTANNTPKKATIAGLPFVRSKNGNLHRLGAVTSKRWESICQYVAELQ